MSKFEDKTGLRDSEKAGFQNFTTELTAYFSEISKLPIKVLLWGPGEGTTFFHKRNVIKEYLRSEISAFEVVTSEDLFRSIEHPTEIDQVQLEMLHAKVANVIFGLVTSDPQQTGIFMEIDNLLRYDSLIQKTWVIMPDPRDWKKAGTFIHQPLLQSFPQYRTKTFRIRELNECNQIRKFCLDKVKEQKGRLMRNRVQNLVGK